jgi:hypothetical protein
LSEAELLEAPTVTEAEVAMARQVRSNSAVESDAFVPALRACARAPHRGR